MQGIISILTSMKLPKNVFSSLGLLNNSLLLVKYKFISKPDPSVLGYSGVDINIIAKRYLNSSLGVNENKLLSIGAFKDLQHFLNTDCLDKFKKNKKWNILDVGCGSGVYSKLFIGKSFPYGKVKYEGCEIDERLVRVCKKINPGTDFFVSFANKLNASDKKYDIVFSSSVLHYTLAKWKESLKEFIRVSKKYILLTRVPFSKYYPTFYVRQTVTGLHGRESHHFVVINRDEFEDYLGKLGLKILARDYSSEQYNVNGIRERIMLMEYLLEK